VGEANLMQRYLEKPKDFLPASRYNSLEIIDNFLFIKKNVMLSNATQKIGRHIKANFFFFSM
jgi:hypothetical protein